MQSVQFDMFVAGSFNNVMWKQFILARIKSLSSNLPSLVLNFSNAPNFESLFVCGNVMGRTGKFLAGMFVDKTVC